MLMIGLSVFPVFPMTEIVKQKKRGNLTIARFTTRGLRIARKSRTSNVKTHASILNIKFFDSIIC